MYSTTRNTVYTIFQTRKDRSADHTSSRKRDGFPFAVFAVHGHIPIETQLRVTGTSPTAQYIQMCTCALMARLVTLKIQSIRTGQIAQMKNVRF